MVRIVFTLVFALPLLLAAGVFADATKTVPFGAPEGRSAAVTPAGDSGWKVTFQPVEWPNALWSAGEGKSWNWQGSATLAFDAANPGTDAVDFHVRIDDDPSSDGWHHCHTANATLGAGQSGTFFIDLASPDSKAVMGMNGGPPVPGRAGMQAMNGGGSVDPTHIVAFQIFLHQPSAPQTLTVTNLRLLSSPSADDLYKGIVDSFGQFTRADWPGKLHAEADFAVRRAEEAKSLAAHPTLPGRDSYGGWADGPTLPHSGYFATVKRDGKWWLVTPSGHLFLSLGMDCMNMWADTIVQPRETLFTSLPGPNDPLAKFYGQDDHVLYGPYKSGKTFNFYRANLQRKYGPNFEQAWGETSLARLKSWGFNTIGNWSDETLEAVQQVPYTATLGIDGDHARVASGSDYWGKMHDPFDPQFAIDCDHSFQDKAARRKDDPWCVGWFVDNELSWGGGNVEKGRYGLAYGALAAPADQPAKKAFLTQLQAKYGTIESFNTAWRTTLTGWAALNASYPASQTPDDAQKADMSAFVYSFAKQYFTVVRDALKKYDPNHLYLGCRFAWGYNPDAVRASAEVCDAVSVNIYQTRLKNSDLESGYGFPADPADLGKPCIIGEFHCGALDRGMFHPGLVSTPNQAARAAMYADYMDSVIDNPAFVGAHWFQYLDEPLTGRTLDGENYNIGFVTVTDTPYPEMVQSARAVLASAYTRRAHGK